MRNDWRDAGFADVEEYRRAETALDIMAAAAMLVVLFFIWTMTH